MKQPAHTATADEIIARILNGDLHITEMPSDDLRNLRDVLTARLNDANTPADAHINLVAAVILSHLQSDEAADLEDAICWLIEFGDVDVETVVSGAKALRRRSKGRPAA